MDRQTATNAKPLSLAQRKASLAKIAADAPAELLAGIALIDVREPTARERALAETLVPMARRALARSGRKAA